MQQEQLTAGSWDSGLTTGSVALTNCIAWALGAYGFQVSSLNLSGAGACTLTSCISGYASLTSCYGFNIADAGSAFPSCRSVGISAMGFIVLEVAQQVADGILDGAVSHSNGGVGMYSPPISSAPKTSRLPYPGETPPTTTSVRHLGGSTSLGSVLRSGHGGHVRLRRGEPLPSYTAQVADSLAGAGAASFDVSGGSQLTVMGGTLNGTPAIRAASCTVVASTWTNFAAPTFLANDTDQGPLSSSTASTIPRTTTGRTTSMGTSSPTETPPIATPQAG